MEEFRLTNHTEREKVKELTGKEWRDKDEPGYDLFDDGLVAGERESDGNNCVEAGDNYALDKGPNDLTIKEDHNTKNIAELDPEITIKTAEEVEQDTALGDQYGVRENEQDEKTADWLKEAELMTQEDQKDQTSAA